MSHADLVARLSALLERVHLGLESAAEGYIVIYERERHPLAELPLADLVEGAEEAELMAVAAGIDAAIKTPGELAPGETLLDGGASLLPRIERRRFITAYDAVLDGRHAAEGERLYHHELGGDLVVCYVQDAGWRFSWVVRGRVTAWGASADTVRSLARSNLYNRQPLDHRASQVAMSDGYDAARVVLIDDVFYDRVGAEGLPLALPSRDQLLIGPEIDAERLAQAYAEATYPLSPHILSYRQGALHRTP